MNFWSGGVSNNKTTEKKFYFRIQNENTGKIPSSTGVIYGAEGHYQLLGRGALLFTRILFIH